MSFWRGKRILVTGGAGFIGSHLVEQLLGAGAQVRVCGRSRQKLFDKIGSAANEVEFLEGDLADLEFAEQACRQQEAVFHLAAMVAGVGYNSTHPGSILFDNATIGLNILEAAVRQDVERISLTSSACIYRRYASVPTPEVEGFLDDPEPSNLGYGWAKRFLEVQARCYVEQYPIKIALPRPYNAYGPRDDFDWETSHVIPALIRKVIEGQNPIKVWGDGSQTRAFLYVTDFVAGLMLSLEHYATCDPVNIGSEEEVTIAALIQMIIDLVGSEAEIAFDTSQPGGQPRRIGDYTKAHEIFNFEAQVPLAEGLRRTITWYKEQPSL
ncbi:MAG: SDR family NAD(P)-dependent oxidoreductase [Anaerolineae bacterium]|nr:SDR family NAD(P)-dependent oxidoreductase [Anaerolineae bacterium]